MEKRSPLVLAGLILVFAAALTLIGWCEWRRQSIHKQVQSLQAEGVKFGMPQGWLEVPAFALIEVKAQSPSKQKIQELTRRLKVIGIKRIDIVNLDEMVPVEKMWNFAKPLEEE